MKYRSLTVVVLALSFVLAQCTPQSEPDADDGVVEILSALDGAEWAAVISQGSGVAIVRPSALIGVFTAHYLVHANFVGSALAGIEAQMDILFDMQGDEDEAFALLEELGTMLQVDVPDMLNRSTERANTFDAYVDDLRDTAVLSQAKLASIEQESENISDERSDARRERSSIRSQLNGALRDGDYATASGLQKSLIAAEANLAELDAMVDEKRSMIRLFEDLLEVAGDRIAAMEANRQALLAGIRVVELPGIDDLGILEQGRRRRSGDLDTIFGTDR